MDTSYSCLLLLLGLAAVHAGTLELPLRTAGYIQLQDYNFDNMLRMFRENLLDKVSAEMNDTVRKRDEVKANLDACQGQIELVTDACASCTQQRCGQDPPKVKLTDLLLSPLALVNKPIEQIADTLGDVAKLLGKSGKRFVKNIGGAVKDIGKSVGDFFEDTFDTVKDGLSGLHKGIKKIGSALGKGIKKIGSSLTSGVKKIGHKIGGAVKKISSKVKGAIKKISSWRRKREIDSDTRACMRRCETCHPLLLDEEAMIREVCGGEVVEEERALQAGVEKMMGVYNATIDTKNVIIADFEYDPASLDTQAMAYTRVRVTVMIDKTERHYRSQVPYYLLDLPRTARELADEYWDRW